MSTVIDFDNWGKQQPTLEKKTKKKKKPEIVFNIFFQFSREIVDDYWKKILEKMAYGKFPSKKFSYANNVLSYTRASRSKSLSFLSSNINENAHLCVDFIRCNGSMYSPLDIEISNDNYFSRESNLAPLSWGSVNKKMRDCLIDNFIVDQYHEMKLTKEQKQNLRDIINWGLIHNVFDKNTIEMRDNRIYNIEGLQWNGEVFLIEEEILENLKDKDIIKIDEDEDIEYDRDCISQIVPQLKKELDRLAKKREQFYEKKHLLQKKEISMAIMSSDDIDFDLF